MHRAVARGEKHQRSVTTTGTICDVMRLSWTSRVVTQHDVVTRRRVHDALRGSAEPPGAATLRHGVRRHDVMLCGGARRHPAAGESPAKI